MATIERALKFVLQTYGDAQPSNIEKSINLLKWENENVLDSSNREDFLFIKQNNQVIKDLTRCLFSIHSTGAIKVQVSDFLYSLN